MVIKKVGVCFLFFFVVEVVVRLCVFLSFCVFCLFVICLVFFCNQKSVYTIA